MPKTAKGLKIKLKQFVKDFGDVFSIRTDVISKNEYLFCLSCQTRVECGQRSQVRQHLNTQNHTKSLKNFNKNQKTVAEMFDKNQNTFNEDLCRLLVKLNIPFHKLGNKDFKQFFEKYTDFSLPAPNTLWSNHLKNLYDMTTEIIRSELKDQYIWLGIDETRDCFGRKVANIIVGSLDCDSNNCKKLILNFEFIDNTKSHTIVQSVTTGLMILWPEGIKYDRLLLLLTDAAPYMKSAANTLCEI